MRNLCPALLKPFLVVVVASSLSSVALLAALGDRQPSPRDLEGRVNDSGTSAESAAAEFARAVEQLSQDENDSDLEFYFAKEDALIAKIKHNVPTAEELEQAVTLLSHEEWGAQMRAAFDVREDFLKAELVGLLRSPALVVRLGAIDLLEGACGEDFGFEPWVDPTDTEANAGAIARWEQWAGEETELQRGLLPLTEEQGQAHLRDLLSDDRDRSARARRLLSGHGLEGVRLVQEHLVAHPKLPAGQRARLKETQYFLILVRTRRDSAHLLARDLAFGTRDQTLAALGPVARTGLSSIPILRDFIESPDALVRETALDALLSVGRSHVFDLVAPVLEKEQDANVIHGVLRQLKKIPSRRTQEMIAPYLEHEDEDIVISTLGVFTAQASSRGSGKRALSGDEDSQRLVALIADPRWRVRAAALEYVTKGEMKIAREAVLERLDDEDEYVRSGAIKAAVALKISEATDRLRGMFFASEESVGPVLSAYNSLEKVPDKEMITHLESGSVDMMIAAVNALDSRESGFVEILIRFAQHQDLDVACTALRTLCGDYKNIADNRVASVALQALQSGSVEKIEAVVSSVRLPEINDGGGDSHSSFRDYKPYSGPPTLLDPLYAAFLEPLSKRQGALSTAEIAVVPEVEGAIGEVGNALYRIAKTEGDQAFKAALGLFKAGDPRASQHLLGIFPELSPSSRAAITDATYHPKEMGSLELYRLLLRDEVKAIREDAANNAMSSSGFPEFVGLVLEELSVPDAVLRPSEVYGYRAEGSLKKSGFSTKMLDWARGQVTAQGGDEELKILALILLRTQAKQEEKDAARELTKSENPWLRRAAWEMLGMTDRKWFEENLSELLADSSSKVREVLPRVATRMHGGWRHHFNDVDAVDDRLSQSDARNVRISDALGEALVRQAVRDASDEVRFEAQSALMTNGRAINIPAYLKLLAAMPKEREIGDRIADYLEDNASRVGPGLAPLLSHANLERIDSDDLQTIVGRISVKGADSFLSFDSLVAADAEAAQGVQQEGPIVDAVPAEPRSSLELIYFHKVGCEKCARVDEYLDILSGEFPLLHVTRHRLVDELPLNQALCTKFEIPIKDHTKAPSLFTQAGGLIDAEISPQELQDLLADTMRLSQDDGWATFGEEELEEAVAEVGRTFDALTLSVILGAGLIDGINPCAFATIIFFLSYLQIAKRSPREILMVGIAFISAVFLAYLAAGLVLYQVLDNIVGAVGGVRVWLTWVFAGFALLVAVLSLRDGLRARRGNIEDMSLQLPGFLKNRIRGVIRKGARARNFVIAAFVSGIAISFLELACTGQVYAPIVYKIQQGELNAVFYLVVYCLAFIAPLVLIFLLAYRGMKSDALIAFQQRHTALVKFAMAALFFLLAALLLFQDKIPFLSHAISESEVVEEVQIGE